MGLFKQKTKETGLELPESVRAHLEDFGQILSYEPLEEESWVIASEFALVVANSQGVVCAGLWADTQYCGWEADSRRLSIVWVDPERSPFQAVTVSENPVALMRLITREVERPIVLRRQAKVSPGTTVVAIARRRLDDSIFTSAVVRGQNNADATQVALTLEQEIREELGIA